MKLVSLLSILMATILSCNQGKEKPAGPGTEVSNTNKPGGKSSDDITISFKADADAVSTDGWIVQRFLWDDKTPAPWLNITSNMHKDKRTINVNLNGTSPGSYSLSGSGMMKNSHGSYFPDFSNPMENFSFENGEFVISSIDTVRNMLSGTFSGVARNSEGKSISITDGKLINVKLKPGVTNLSAELEKLGN